MSAEQSDRPLHDPCVVCGENVLGEPHLALALFGVFTGTHVGDLHDGILFEPDGDPFEFESWHDVPLARFVHLRCATAYFEGVAAECMVHVRRDRASRSGDA